MPPKVQPGGGPDKLDSAPQQQTQSGTTSTGSENPQPAEEQPTD